MELKVWVDGIQRIVCGVTENTTCQDVVYALAHATGKTGRFTLCERWRSNKRLLSPQDNPLKVLLKWGEYSNDVQLILQQSLLDENKATPPNLLSKQKHDLFEQSFYPTGIAPECHTSPEKYKDIRKSLTFTGNSNVTQNSDHHPSNRIGVVKGVPKRQDNLQVRESKHMKFESNSPSKADSSSVSSTSPARREAPPYREPPGPPSGSPHQRALPPYRNPPPPTSSPVRSVTSGAVSPTSSMIVQSNCKALKPNNEASTRIPASPENLHQEAVLCNSQYRDLVRLVNFQREKLSAQQSDLTKVSWDTMFRAVVSLGILVLFYIYSMNQFEW